MKENNIVLYSPVLNSRKEYVFHFIFSEVLGLPLKMESNRDSLSVPNGVIVNYSNDKINGAIQFSPHGLLDEDNIAQNLPDFGDWNLFITGSDDPDNEVNSFDPFAFAFYLLTRYEEYLPHTKDKYGRYSAENSMGFKAGFLDKPIIELCAFQIAHKIKYTHSNFTFPDKKWQYQFTIDIDNAFAFRGKGFLRTLGGYMRAFLLFNWQEIGSRLKVNIGVAKDPYDTYNYLIEKLEPFAANTTAFFLVGNYGNLDKNVPYQNPELQEMAHHISEKFGIGLHPSAGSNGNDEQLMIEKDRLNSMTLNPITKSRQHYLLLDFPATYKSLIGAGIDEDYTMGYPDHLGFRAGTSYPHRFFDLTENRITNLTIHPFVVMDVALKNYLGLTPQQAVNEIRRIIDVVQKVNGTFIMIWHNESLSEKGEWIGWKRVFEEMLAYWKRLS